MLLHHIKIKITFSFLVTFCLFQANANPKIDKVISGQVEFQKENKNLTIHQRSDRAIIDWIDFSIKENETTHIQALKDDFAILNRVSTSHPSKIFGKLTSNANVYLINQNGILIGKNALIDTNKLTLSTLDIGNAAFLNADDLHFETQRLEKIVNKGKIHALDDIIILAPKIKNLNEIVSKNGSVNLLGASYVILAERKNPQIGVKVANTGYVSNEGLIKAALVQLRSSDNNIYSFAIHDSGIIEATGAINKNGRVILTADTGTILVDSEIKANDIQITADEIYVLDKTVLDVSSDSKEGKILIGGDFQGKNPSIKNARKTIISEGAEIIADGLKDNNAGKVIIFSEEATSCLGNISARAENGDGGFVEISSNDKLLDVGDVDLSSLHGKIGTLLLDPGSVLIKKGTNTDLGANVFTDSYINNQLKVANVEILTKNSLNNEEESITIDKDVNIFWDQDTTFSLQASKNIIMKANAKIENISDEAFLAIHFKTTGENGNFSGILIDENASIKTNTADIKLEGISGNIGDSNYGIHHRGLIQTKGNLELIGRAKRGDNNNVGILFDGGKILSKNGSITIDGTSLGTKQANDGVNFANYSQLGIENSKLSIRGIASGTNSTGVNFDKSKIETTGDTLIEIYGKESGKLGISLSEDSKILSQGTVLFKATNKMHSYGHIVSRGSVHIDIGLEKEGQFVLTRNITAKDLTLNGNEFNDTFYFDCPQRCKIIGGAGQNTLIAANLSNKFEIKDVNSGLLNNEITFSQIQNLKGSNYNDDIFIFSLKGKVDGKVDGNGGKNTLKAPSHDNLWVITSEDTGYIRGIVNFRNIQNLFGNDKNDTFRFKEDSKINGVINGFKGYNVLDYSAFDTDLTLDLHKVENIHEVIGANNHKNILIGPEDVNIWKITDCNKGQVGAIKFDHFQSLVGSGINDVFYIEANGRLDGEINGSGGDNSLFASNRKNIWYITGANRGFIENILTFSNIQNLYGNENEDIFKFTNYAFISGKIDGKSNLNNILDFSKHTSIVSIDLNKIDNIQKIIGGGKTTLKGKDSDNTWDIIAENAGLLNKAIAFLNIENIVGGSKKDIFAIQKEGSMGYIDGSNGDNTLQSPQMDNIWNLYALNEGVLNDLKFKNISNLKGSTNKDSFYFEKEAKISGKIDGGLGKDNIMDFSKQIAPVSLDLNRIENVSTIIGGKNTDTLIGRDENNIWLFSSFNEGHVQDVDFIGFENIKGGKQSDVFVFRDNSGVSGVIDGGNDGIALNILDYSLCTKPISADIYSGESANTLSTCNIQATVLPNFKSTKKNHMASGLEIPLKQTQFDVDYYEDNFVKFFESSPNLKYDFGSEKFRFPIYVTNTKNGPIYVYRASSPFVITNRTAKAIYINSTLSPYLADNRVADAWVRMKNNLLTTINNQKLAIRGNLDQIHAVYEREESGFDQPNVRIVPQNIKDKSIKQRPRPLHYYSKN